MGLTSYCIVIVSYCGGGGGLSAAAAEDDYGARRGSVGYSGGTHGHPAALIRP